jgi:hypothetical protein
VEAHAGFEIAATASVRWFDRGKKLIEQVAVPGMISMTSNPVANARRDRKTGFPLLRNTRRINRIATS